MNRTYRENKNSLSRFDRDLVLSSFRQSQEKDIREAHAKFLEEMELKKKGLLPMYAKNESTTHPMMED